MLDPQHTLDMLCKLVKELGHKVPVDGPITEHLDSLDIAELVWYLRHRPNFAPLQASLASLREEDLYEYGLTLRRLAERLTPSQGQSHAND